ncbi:MAG: 3'-5' exoribonuclease [Thermoanaerobaculia bacterium]|nr:3'-5' exoribonuclease [Thermoanaerobaculia bacterium]
MTTLRLFYDCEFLERGPGHPLELIALGIVSDDGRELYRVNAEFDVRNATPWLREHVLPHLPPAGDPAWKPRAEIAAEVRALVGEAVPELWGDSAYDHVLLAQLFGDMTGWPPGWPYFTHELAQLRESVGNPELPKNEGREHHALDDAKWLRQAWRFLKEKE